jgi:2-methylcitrate dehydratase PrpD
MSEKAGPYLARQLAEFVSGRSVENLSEDAVAQIKRAILDQFGCQLVASTLAWNQPARRVMTAAGGAAEATVVNTGERVPAASAAYVNAAFGHGAELDDYANAAGAHTGAVVVPVAVALAERGRLRGADLIAAVSVGYDVSWGLGTMMRRGLHHRGYHSHAVLTTFSATCTAAALLGLGVEQIEHAIGIAGSYASGTMEYDQSGGEVKRVHSAIAAQSGIQSAMLADAGLTGPAKIFEGRRGILRVLAGFEDPESAVLSVAEGEGVLGVGFKRYPITASQHTPVALLTHLMNADNIGAADIGRIDLDLAPALLLHIGTIYEPQEAIQAQFSLAYSLAVRAVHESNDLSLYENPSAWRDPVVLDLAQRIQFHTDPGAKNDKHCGEMRITLTDGRMLKISPSEITNIHDVSTADLESKYRKLSTIVVSEARSEALLEGVNALERCADVSALCALLVSDRK